jgi:serine/threonine protein kinase
VSEASGSSNGEEARPPIPGDLIAGKYRLEGLLGRGGMGVVFAARHELLQQPVAIKFLGPSITHTAASIARFFNEARATARIQNDHVCRVLDFGVLPSGSPYLVMERLEGQDLSRVIATGGPMPITRAIDYCLQALEAVAEAHALGIVHRDLKPANLFVARRPDGSTRIKVLDFGVSKIASTEPAISITTTAAPLGSPAYMSPEQVRDPKSVDRRTDLWSMGVILYEMLAGRSPFVGPSLGEIYSEILEREIPPLRSRRPDVPPEVEQALASCLRRDRGERPPDAAALAAQLVGCGSAQAAVSLERIRGVMRAFSAVSTTLPLPSASAALAQTRTRPGPRSVMKSGVALLLVALAVAAAGLFLLRRAPVPAAAPPARPSQETPVISPPAPPVTIPIAQPLPVSPPATGVVAAPVAPAPAHPPVRPTSKHPSRVRAARPATPPASGQGILDYRQ